MFKRIKLRKKTSGSSVTSEQKKYRKHIRIRKILLYAVLVISFFVVFSENFTIYKANYKARLMPQIRRAVIQVAQIIPQLEESEAALRKVCDQMMNSWDRMAEDGLLQEGDYYIPDTEAKLEQFVGATLSWMDRVTKLKVGRDGSVVVLSKDTMTVLAHPDESLTGIQLVPADPLSENNVLDLKSVTSVTKPEDLDTEFNYFELQSAVENDIGSFAEFDAYMSQSLYGCLIEYEDYYIICGISIYELASFLSSALISTVILFLLIWLIIRWIGLVLDRRCETTRSLRNKLVSYSLIVCLISFAISWYFQTLNNVADELKTMTHHAEVAVETLDTYEKQSELLGEWMDSFYEIQCRLASLIIKGRNRDALSSEEVQPPNRAAMQIYADYLNVKYVFLFDEEGQVVVTNSNYDHLKVGNKPGDQLYEFRVLLEGADIVIQPPMKDERYNEYIQYIGVSMRNEEDLCDGFVMIGVDPTLRDELLDALTIDTVLNNLIIGLPDYAVAIDKETLTVSATTGLGYVGESVEELGLSRENLEQRFSGFIEINDHTYYAGVSASEDQYLVPIMRKSSDNGAFISSCKLALAAAIILCIITFMTLFRYQKDVLDAFPSDENDPNRDIEVVEIDDEEEDIKPTGLISGILERTKARNKKGFEERWNVNTVSTHEQTPEKRILRIVYRLLLLFCLFILLPTLYVGLNSDSNIGSLNNLAYVISGKWEKGVNIFAFTACIFLLCAMYVFSVLLDLILYHVARASDMRVETVCLLIKNAMKYICVIIFVYYGLAQFGVNTQTLLASAGILSLMISLGAKDMVSDILAGFFIIFESTYKVGDYINVGSWSGTVTEIGLRTTKVKKDTDIKIFNNSSMRDIINCEDVIRIAVKMPISYDADIPEIEDILAAELPLIGSDRIPGLVKAPRCDGVSSFEDSSVMILIVMFVERTSRFPATRALNRELKIIFDRRGVEIPFNQIVVHEAKNVTEQ